MSTTAKGIRPAIWVDNTGLSTKGYEVVFGRYEQDNDLTNGPEPIEWIVLDAQDGKSLLISKYTLDAKPFHELKNRTYWDSSTLRKWLNSSFFQDTFSKSEQQAILSTNIDNSKEQGNPAWNTKVGSSNTVDSVFLLSYAEVMAYYNSDHERQCEPTAYAATKGASVKGGCSLWWTRSASFRDYLNYAGTVSPEGSTNTAKNVSSKKGGVRPAIWIDQEKLKFALEKNRLSDELNRATQEGTTVTFGQYEQDNDTENGAEPIEWILLEAKGNKYLLLSKYILDWKQFVESDKYYTWEVSTLRSWLNQDFIETAFGDIEKKLISKNYVDNSYGQGIPGVNVYGGGNTSDSSFILSYAEAQRFFPTDEDRTCMQTEFAKTQGVSKEESSRWWLRSPGTAASKTKQNGVCAVNSNGSIGTFFAGTTMQGVRPSIWIDLDAVFK